MDSIHDDFNLTMEVTKSHFENEIDRVYIENKKLKSDNQMLIDKCEYYSCLFESKT